MIRVCASANCFNKANFPFYLGVLEYGGKNYFRLVALCPSCFLLWEKKGLIKNKPNKIK